MFGLVHSDLILLKAEMGVLLRDLFGAQLEEDGPDVLTLNRYCSKMDDSKRATIYFDAEVHRALRMRAAACNRSISNMVN